MSEDSAQRLQNDLNVVMEKVHLCREIMLVSPGIQHDETLAGVVGFLEACRDRMGDLIEAGTQGLLGEDLFEKALSVNDAVNRTLDAERNGTKIAVNEEEASGSKEKGEEKSLLDLDDGAVIAAGGAANTKPSATAASSSAPVTKPKADDSLLAPYVAPAAAAPSSSATEADPFGADFETKPLDLPTPPAPAPVSPNLPQAHMVPTPPTALDVQNTVMTPSVKNTTAEAAPRDNPEAAAEDFDAFLASLDK